MTITEAMNQVDLAITDLGIKFKEIDEPLSAEVNAYFSHYFGERWEKSMEQLFSGELTPAQYVSVRFGMIEEYRSHRFFREVEKKIASL